MSAFLVDDLVYASMARYLREQRPDICEIALPAAGFPSYTPEQFMRKVRLLNHLSLNVRYNDAMPAPGTLAPLLSLDAARIDARQALGQANCIDYQSCETPVWHDKANGFRRQWAVVTAELQKDVARKHETMLGGDRFDTYGWGHIEETPTPSTQPRRYVTVADAAKEIRAALKAKFIRTGGPRQQVSVKSDSYSGGSSISVTILDHRVSFAVVEGIATGQESIDRCSITGEILSGANRYVSVKYADEALKALAATLDPSAPVVNGFRLYADTERKGDYYACRWPAGDGPKAASATVRSWGLLGIIHAALTFAE